MEAPYHRSDCLHTTMHQGRTNQVSLSSLLQTKLLAEDFVKSEYSHKHFLSTSLYYTF